jgi:hypothetical protein
MSVRQIKPVSKPQPLLEYFQRFGHRPSREALKFKTEEELVALAIQALRDNQPVESWEKRPSQKTGTLLDEYYRNNKES